MPERFNLDATLAALGQAAGALVCHALFDAAVHGLAVAAAVAAVGLLIARRQSRLGRPLLAAGRKLGIFCAALAVPGLISLLTSGRLPPVGVFHFSSLGFVVFWSLISLHLSAEEMNFQWFS